MGNNTSSIVTCKMSCPHETFILTLGRQKVDIYTYFFSIKNISKGKTSNPNSSIFAPGHHTTGLKFKIYVAVLL